MAGTSDPKAAPFPYGQGYFIADVGGFSGGHNIGSLTIDTYQLPFDCYIRRVIKTYHTNAAAALDGVSLKTADGGLNIDALGDESADVAGVEMAWGTAHGSLHTDVRNVRLLKGDKLILIADAVTGEGGNIRYRVFLEPTLTAEVHP